MIKIILNGTGTVAQTVPETTTISKIRSGVYHYHFQIFFLTEVGLYYRITAVSTWAVVSSEFPSGNGNTSLNKRVR